MNRATYPTISSVAASRTNEIVIGAATDGQDWRVGVTAYGGFRLISTALARQIADDLRARSKDLAPVWAEAALELAREFDRAVMLCERRGAGVS